MDGVRYALNEVQDNVFDFAVFMPVRRHAQKGYDVRGRPPIQTDVDGARQVLCETRVVQSVRE